MTHDEMIAVIQAHKRGKKIECEYKQSLGIKHDCPQPSFDFDHYNYYIKSEPHPQIVPWKDLREYVGKIVQSKTTGNVHTILYTTLNGKMCYVGGISLMNCAEMLENFFLYPSREPCGDYMTEKIDLDKMGVTLI